MIVTDALKIINENHKNEFLVECCDFGEFYGFIFSKEKPNEKAKGSFMYETVDKKTGNTGFFSAIDNLKVFRNGVKIQL